MSYCIEAQRAEETTNCLLDWYDENKRDLPWRHTQNPYGIWISEIMAQQTRISFLLAYYNRFMEQFPTVQTLASASEAEVFKAWEGLGYYSRARNLKSAAQKIMTDFGGEVPKTKEELLKLPGIGEYTAGAILSIAYNIPVPAVDGNVLRVFSRLENSEEDIMLPKTKQTAADFVSAIMPAGRAGCFTQALMELGALVCIPKNPRCVECPVFSLCKAYQDGRQHELPKKTAKKPQKKEDKTILIIRNSNGAILMRRRSEKLLSGLWAFYLTDFEMSEQMVYEHLTELRFLPANIRKMGGAKHVFTHIIWQMQGYDCQIDGGDPPEGYQWIAQADIKNLAIPAAFRFYTKQL